MKKFVVGLLAAAMMVTSVNTTAFAADVSTKAAGAAITLDKSKGNPITGFNDTDEIMYGGDPSILVDGDTVYLYVGHDVSASSGYNMPDWHCYSSTDMENWNYEGEIMSASKDEISWTTTGNEAWAGQVMKYNGLYYLYYCTSKGSKAIGVSVADSPTGWTSAEAKAEYCASKSINDKNPTSLHFVDIGHPLAIAEQTWPNHAGHDDIDPTAWIETDEKGVEHRYLGWGNSFFFLCELNEDMISIKDLNEDGLITMKTTRSLLTTDDSTSVKYSDTKARSTVVDQDYGYPQAVTYTDFEVDGAGNYSEVSKTIDKDSEYPDGDIICSKFHTVNTTGAQADTVYTDDTNTTSAVDNDGKSLAGLIKYNDDDSVNGLFTYSDTGSLRYHFFTEAPYLYRRQDADGNYYGKYYLFSAVDWREQMAYAVTDDISNADWEFKNVIMPWSPTADTNHMAVFDFKGKTYFIYHDGSLPFGFGNRRSVCVEELNFDEDGNILPITQTSTGVTGTTSWISDTSGNNITHETVVTTKDGNDYPMVSAKAKKVGMEATENENDAKWEIVAAKAQDYKDDASYVSIEAWNAPGLYLTTSGTDVVLSQLSTADYKVNWSNGLAEAMTYKTVTGLNGKGVSFESLAQPGMYLTSDGSDLSITDGSDADACSFDVSSRAALKSISAVKTKLVYNTGDKVDDKDVIVTKNYKDGTTAAATGYTTNAASIDTSKAGAKTLTVTYKEDNFERTANVTIYVAAVSLNKSSVALNAGSSTTLKATTTPAGVKVTWASSNAKVATVDANGKVTAKANGTAVITAKVGNKTASCKVTVTTVATSVKLSKTAVKLTAGKSYTLKATVAPTTTSNKRITWTSSKSSVAAVANGKVTAKKAGTALITAKTVNGKKASCKVTVASKKVAVKKVVLSKTKLSLKVGKSTKLKASFKPSNAKSSIKWTTSKKSVATVKNGKVTGKKKGTAVITAKSSNGKKATCKVTVKK